MSPLAEALNQKNTKTVGMLPSFGALVGHKHDDKKSKLIIACCTGSLERVKSLVTKGAKVDVRTPHGLTCLLVAAKNKHRNVVSYFLEQGSSSANDVDADGYTLLHHAVMLNDPHAVSTLIAEGLDVDAKTRVNTFKVFVVLLCIGWRNSSIPCNKTQFRGISWSALEIWSRSKYQDKGNK